MIKLLQKHAKATSYISGAVVGLGMLGYVGGRMIAPSDPGLVGVVFASTYIVLVGLALFGLVLVGLSSIARHPVVLRGLAAVLLVFGIVLALFPYSRSAAWPEGALVLFAMLLLMVGWNDLCDPKLWRNARLESDLRH